MGTATNEKGVGHEIEKKTEKKLWTTGRLMIFFSYALYVLYDMWPRRHFDMCVYMHRNKKRFLCEGNGQKTTDR